MKFRLSTLLAFVAWCACTLFTLQLGRVQLPVAYEHLICGPWGCGPRAMDLLSYHLFLLCITLLLCYWAAVTLPPKVVRHLGQGGLLLGAATLLGLLLYEVSTSWSAHRDHFVQLYLFRIATSVDLPAPAFLIGGGLLCWWGAAKKPDRRPGTSSARSESELPHCVISGMNAHTRKPSGAESRGIW